ncbi:MAG: hypothetical protein WBA93_06725 [Microcoleaceae cyanobacterium]
MKISKIIGLAVTILATLFLSLFIMEKAWALNPMFDENSNLNFEQRKIFTNSEFCLNLNNSNIVFRGEGNNNQQGIYVYLNGYLTTIANQNTPMPEGTGKFTRFGFCPKLDRDNVVFTAEGSEQQQGIYISIDGFLSPVTNRKTRIPNGQGTFTEFGYCLGIDDEKVVFLGYGDNNQQGVYIYEGGLLSTVVDRTTPIPRGEGTFTGFGSCAAINHENVVFLGYGSNNQQGIYTLVNDSLFAIADFDTPIPRGKGTFTGFGSFLVNDNANVSFPTSSFNNE